MTGLFALLVLTLVGPADASIYAPNTRELQRHQIHLTQPQDSQRRVHGHVLSEPSGQPLALALVEFGTGPARRHTITDEEGHYFLEGVAAGPQRVRVSTIDHAPLEITVQVPATGILELDLSLRLSPLELRGLTVVSRRVHPIGAQGSGGERPGRGTPADPELRALESSPGLAELGVVDGTRAEPPTDPGDPESALYVRGAASDLKLVLLDGAPVYAPFHLGGLMEAFQPDILSSAWLFSGGAPARYDGGLSYILDLQTRPGDAQGFRTAGAVDMLGAGGRIEGPLAGDAAYLASARVVHRAGTDSYTPEPLPYGYADALARLDIGLAPQHRLSLTGFFNRESVSLSEVSALEEPARWGNTAGSLRYHGRLLGGESRITAALADFSTRLPIGIESPGVAYGRSIRTRLAADLERPLAGARLAYGLSYDRQRIDYRGRQVTDSSVIWADRQGEADVLGGYGEVIWHPAKGLDIRSGLRANLFLSADAPRLAPRVALAWQMSESSTLSLAGGRFYQYLRVPETILSSDLEDAWVEVVAGQSTGPARYRALAVAGASHLSVGLSHEPRDDLRLGMEGYYKAFGGAREVQGLRASGVDLWIDWSNGPWRAWAGYSLAWAWADGNRDSLTQRFSARHLLSGGLRAPLPSGVRFDLHLSSSHGLPFTAIPAERGQGTGPNLEPTFRSLSAQSSQQFITGEPDGSYLRLDAQISRAWPLRLFGTDVELVPYLKVLNALDRRDALFYQFNAGRDLRPQSLEAVPLLPVLGLEWRH